MSLTREVELTKGRVDKHELEIRRLAKYLARISDGHNIVVETITVTAGGASGSPATIDITFTVNATLVLDVTPASRADTVIAGSTTAVIDSADVTITGPGSGTQAWNATHTAAAWLTLTTDAGTGNGKVRWSRNPTGLTAGTYVDTIVVTSTNAGGSPASVIDTLLVQEALALAVTPNSRSSGVVLGSTAAVTDSADVTLTGFGAVNQAWTATHTAAAWLTLTTAAGTGTGKVRWSRDPTGLALGTYVDTVTVTSAGAAGSPATIVDTLIVDQALVLTLDPTTLSDTTTGGSTTATSDSVSVTLTGLGSSTAAWTASKSGSTDWLTLTTASGTGSGMVRWTRDPTGLPLGKFVATLTVTAVGATGSPAEIKDTLVVAQALMLSVSPQARADTTMEGATIVSSDSTAVTLIGLGSSTAVWSATHTSAPWLTLTTSGGTSSGMARWTRDPSGLSAGTLVVGLFGDQCVARQKKRGDARGI